MSNRKFVTEIVGLPAVGKSTLLNIARDEGFSVVEEQLRKNRNDFNTTLNDACDILTRQKKLVDLVVEEINSASGRITIVDTGVLSALVFGYWRLPEFLFTDLLDYCRNELLSNNITIPLVLWLYADIDVIRLRAQHDQRERSNLDSNLLLEPYLDEVLSSMELVFPRSILKIDTTRPFELQTVYDSISASANPSQPCVVCDVTSELSFR